MTSSKDIEFVLRNILNQNKHKGEKTEKKTEKKTKIVKTPPE